MTSVLPQVLIITGLMAAGKSSVAQALAEQLSKSVHLRGDLFRRLIVNGCVDVGPQARDEALAQLALRQEIACTACDLYAGAGFSVIYQDVILGRHIEEICFRLKRWSPGLVVLCPSLEVIALRDAKRSKQAYAGAWTPDRLAELLAGTPRLGLWLDNSEMTIGDAVQVILRSASKTVVNVADQFSGPGQ